MRRRVRPYPKTEPSPSKRRKRPSLSSLERPLVEQDATSVDSPARSMRYADDAMFEKKLMEEYNVDDKVLAQAKEITKQILNNEKSGKWNPVEAKIKDVVGVDNTDRIAKFVNTFRPKKTEDGYSIGQETSVGEYNIHKSNVPSVARDQSDPQQAQTMVIDAYIKAKNKGLDDAAAYDIAASAYNRGFDAAYKDYKRGELSEYGQWARGKRKVRPSLDDLKPITMAQDATLRKE